MDKLVPEKVLGVKYSEYAKQNWALTHLNNRIMYFTRKNNGSFLPPSIACSKNEW